MVTPGLPGIQGNRQSILANMMKQCSVPECKAAVTGEQRCRLS